MEIYLCTIMLQNHKWTKDKTPDWPIEELIPKVGPLGYDGLEIWGYHLTGKTDRDLEKIRKLAEDQGLKIGVLAPYFRFTESQELQEASLEEARRYIQICDLTGCRKIRVFTGGPGSADATDEHWRRGVEGIRQACRLAGDRDISWVAETHANMLSDTIATSLRLVRAVDHPKFKLNFQPSTFRQEDPVALYDQLAPHVDHIHANNFGPDRGITLLAEGQIPFKAFIGHLAATGYDRTFSVEFVKGSTVPEQEYSLEAVLDAAGQDLRFIRSLI